MDKNVSRKKLWITLAFLFGTPLTFFLGAKAKNKFEKQKNKTINIIPLKKTEADIRANQVSNINYEISLILDRIESYKGRSIINFDLKDTKNLFLDYMGVIESFIANGKQIKIKSTNNRIEIESQYLNIGNNSIEINYRSLYSTDPSNKKGLEYDRVIILFT